MFVLFCAASLTGGSQPGEQSSSTGPNMEGVDVVQNGDDQKAVNFIVGDEQEIDTNSLDINEEERREDGDMFPTSNGPTGMMSNSNSYKDMFGLAERRKRLR